MYQFVSIYSDQSRKDAKDINRLLFQLSPKAERISGKKLLELLKSPNFFLVSIREDGHIVAMATLLIDGTLMGDYGVVRDVVVDRRCRRRGLAEEVMRGVIALADRYEVAALELTSRPSRRAANKLYQKLGFKKRDTNCYKLNLR